MPQRILTLLGLVIRAGSIKLTPPQPPADLGDSIPPVDPGELRTRDQIVFDTLAWKPSCADLYNNITGDPVGARYLRGNGLPSAELCKQYERHSNSSTSARVVRTGNSSMPPGIRPTKKPIQFLHVSKSGGTFTCMCGNGHGRNEGLSHSNKEESCHYLHEDWPSWGMSASDKNVPWYAKWVYQKSTCASLEKQYHDRNITLEGNENYVGNGGRLCTQFETVLIMRSPIHRIASHVAFMTGEKRVLELTLREILGRWPRLSNNYFARSLSDAPVFYAAHDALPESLYGAARRTLEQFDHVYVMERELAAGLRSTFGWDCAHSKGRASKIPGGTQAVVDHWREAWGRRDWQLLEERNAVDARLFREVQMLNFAQGLQAFARAVA